MQKVVEGHIIINGKKFIGVCAIALQVIPMELISLQAQVHTTTNEG